MRLKEIKPGMAIHCKNDEEKKALLEEAERIGYLWANGDNPTKFSFPSNTLVFKEDGLRKNICWTGDRNKNTEFSDLILPELTAEEAIKLHAEVCKNNCGECPLWEVYGYGNCDDLCFENPEKAVEMLAKWKADNEKKEPEFEWVYRVFGAENFGEKFFNTEEDAIARCEELVKSQKNRQYARYERVCRVKEV